MLFLLENGGGVISKRHPPPQIWKYRIILFDMQFLCSDRNLAKCFTAVPDTFLYT